MKILAISSGGGHWVQLLKLRPAFEGHELAFATVNRSYRTDVGEARFFTVRDATRWNKLGLVILLMQVFATLLRYRPALVVSTGAAPGYFAIRLARLLRIKTLWLDSMANVEKLSLSGQLALKHADLFLTQWPRLANGDSVRYEGSLL